MPRRAGRPGGGSAPPGLGDEQYRALADFRRSLREFLAFSDAAALAEGVTPQQHQALLAIRGCGAGATISIGDLAERLGVANHSAVGLVERLVERGLVSRGRSPQDRRRVMVELRPEGALILARISAQNIGELARMAGFLAQVRRRIRQVRAKAPPSDPSG